MDFVALFSFLDSHGSFSIRLNPDSIHWRWGKNGDFSVKSLFHIIAGGGVWIKHAKYIWNGLIPTKIHFFVWQILHGGVLIEVALKKRGQVPTC